jgi:hypothetical protein
VGEVDERDMAAVQDSAHVDDVGGHRADRGKRGRRAARDAVPRPSGPCVRRAKWGYAKRQEIWRRNYPDKPPLGRPPVRDYASLSVDAIADHARSLGAEVLCVTVHEVARHVDEDVLVVHDDDASERLSGGSMAAVLSRKAEPDATGAFEGDAIFVFTTSARVILVHHEGIILDIRARARAE